MKKQVEWQYCIYPKLTVCRYHENYVQIRSLRTGEWRDIDDGEAAVGASIEGTPVTEERAEEFFREMQKIYYPES